jgi:DNA-binding response OmpR family regulator
LARRKNCRGRWRSAGFRFEDEMDGIGLSALVVDDIRMMRDLLSRMLRSIGFVEVYDAANAEEALKVISERGLHLMVVDWNLGDSNGGDLVQRIRAQKEGARLPILMVSGQTEQATILAARRSGIDGYLLKPVSKADLLARIKFVLAKYKGAA